MTHEEKNLMGAIDAYAKHTRVEEKSPGVWLIRRDDDHSACFWMTIIATPPFLTLVGDGDTAVFYGHGSDTPEGLVRWVAGSGLGYLATKLQMGMGIYDAGHELDQLKMIEDLDGLKEDLSVDEEGLNPVAEAAIKHAKYLANTGDPKEAQNHISEEIEDSTEYAFGLGQVIAPRVIYAREACRALVRLLDAKLKQDPTGPPETPDEGFRFLVDVAVAGETRMGIRLKADQVDILARLLRQMDWFKSALIDAVVHLEDPNAPFAAVLDEVWRIALVALGREVPKGKVPSDVLDALTLGEITLDMMCEILNALDFITREEFDQVLQDTINASPEYIDGVWAKFRDRPLQYCLSRHPRTQGEALFDLVLKKALESHRAVRAAEMDLKPHGEDWMCATCEDTDVRNSYMDGDRRVCLTCGTNPMGAMEDDGLAEDEANWRDADAMFPGRIERMVDDERPTITPAKDDRIVLLTELTIERTMNCPRIALVANTSQEAKGFVDDVIAEDLASRVMPFGLFDSLPGPGFDLVIISSRVDQDDARVSEWLDGLVLSNLAPQKDASC